MSTNLQNKQWLFVKQPSGAATEDCFKLVQAEVPSPKEGEILIQSLYLSVDPYMRGRLTAPDAATRLNKVQIGAVVGKVLESKDTTNNIKQGDIVVAYTGWQLYAVVPAAQATKFYVEFDSENKPSWPISYGLGILGMPGCTAHGGLDEASPKAGETVVVSGAAGAVGLVVVQLAKIKGCRVVGVAGSDDKCELVKSIGADAVINYNKHPDIDSMRNALKEACPKGIDVYFDNTGGHTTDAVFDLINLRARIIICGQISVYNSFGESQPVPTEPRFLHKLIYTRATIKGILVADYQEKYPQMLKEMAGWIKEGKLKFQETVVNGFENLPKAFISLFHGANTGKLVVKA